MTFKIKEVLEGWRNHFSPPEHLKEIIAQISANRLEICRACPHNSENLRKEGKKFSSSWRKDEHCTVCLCPLLQKTKALHSSCPLNPPKWDRIVTDSESIEINTVLEDAEKRKSQ
jgi:hypothetical protein